MLTFNKRPVGCAAAVLCASLLLGACQNGESREPVADRAETGSAGPSPPAALAPAELTWYYPVRELQKDQSAVEEAVNRYTRAKLNATIRLKPVAMSEYAQRMNTVLAANEPVDILWDASWLFNYMSAYAKGALLPLDELLDKYGADVKKALPKMLFDTARIEGKLYAIPGYQTITNREGFYIQKRFVDKYRIDVARIKTFEDMYPYMERIRQGEPGVTPIIFDKGGLYGSMAIELGFEYLTDTLVGIDVAHPAKAVNVYELPAYQTYLKRMRELYVHGYVPPDIGTIKSFVAQTKTGQVAMQYHAVLKPGGEEMFGDLFGGNAMVAVPITEPYVNKSQVIGTMQSIARQSKQPERAMMFLNLLNTDPELFNLLAYGIEGKHYTRVSAGTVRPIPGSGYAEKIDHWVFGNVFNAYTTEGQNPAVAEMTLRMNESAKASPVLGFTFNPEPVQAAIANVTTVIEAYCPAMDTGSIDAQLVYDEFIAKLKAAGADAIVAEAQRQLDAWYKAKEGRT
ncbi:ABC transporter substrate-binding protein [Paenibacillus cymbidii]|uniref:ABC transporter substrate-binding protein n=1 Tax=Paenibacillus cymbidii TaxID=1639034 RepID=UPI0014369BCA|nr:ABC transporter substrate-binding protein [Paenibacillus cymbidii]